MSDAKLTAAQEQALLDEAANPDATPTYGDQSVSSRSASDILLLLDRARMSRQRAGGGSRFRYYRLTSGADY